MLGSTPDRRQRNECFWLDPCFLVVPYCRPFVRPKASRGNINLISLSRTRPALADMGVDGRRAHGSVCRRVKPPSAPPGGNRCSRVWEVTKNPAPKWVLTGTGTLQEACRLVLPRDTVGLGNAGNSRIDICPCSLAPPSTTSALYLLLVGHGLPWRMLVARQTGAP